ncbi:MAG: hypothetical protein C5B51_22525 [Terriglobia bacterium]|nr:MAG: hypothetical protein C5B51_22525 [Terriglobia bacterium]
MRGNLHFLPLLRQGFPIHFEVSAGAFLGVPLHSVEQHQARLLFVFTQLECRSAPVGRDFRGARLACELFQQGGVVEFAHGSADQSFVAGWKVRVRQRGECRAQAFEILLRVDDLLRGNRSAPENLGETLVAVAGNHFVLKQHALGIGK